MARRDAGSEIHRLVLEMERVDCALAAHLHGMQANAMQSCARGSAAEPLAYVRTQIKTWCAAHHGKYDPEVLSSIVMAVDTMSRRELAGLIRGLAARLKVDRRQLPAA